MVFSTAILNLFLLSVCVVSGSEETDLYSFKVTDIENNEVDLETFRGKVSLIIKVASKCVFEQFQYKSIISPTQSVHPDVPKFFSRPPKLKQGTFSFQNFAI